MVEAVYFESEFRLRRLLPTDSSLIDKRRVRARLPSAGVRRPENRERRAQAAQLIRLARGDLDQALSDAARIGDETTCSVRTLEVKSSDSN
jgi:hypothetical protein